MSFGLTHGTGPSHNSGRDLLGVPPLNHCPTAPSFSTGLLTVQTDGFEEAEHPRFRLISRVGGFT